MTIFTSQLKQQRKWQIQKYFYWNDDEKMVMKRLITKDQPVRSRHGRKEYNYESASLGPGAAPHSLSRRRVALRIALVIQFSFSFSSFVAVLLGWNHFFFAIIKPFSLPNKSIYLSRKSRRRDKRKQNNWYENNTLSNFFKTLQNFVNKSISAIIEPAAVTLNVYMDIFYETTTK